MNKRIIFDSSDSESDNDSQVSNSKRKRELELFEKEKKTKEDEELWNSIFSCSDIEEEENYADDESSDSEYIPNDETTETETEIETETETEQEELKTEEEFDENEEETEIEEEIDLGESDTEEESDDGFKTLDDGFKMKVQKDGNIMFRITPKYLSPLKEPPVSNDELEQLEKINKLIDEKELSEYDIVKSNLLDEDKAFYLEKFRIMSDRDVHPLDKLKYKYEIYRKINDVSSLNEEEAIKYKALKEQGRQTILNRILNTSHNQEVQQVLFKKYNRMIKYTRDDSDYIKLHEWINLVLELPTQEKQIIKDNETIGQRINTIRGVMNKHIYGQNEVKDRIIEIMCSKFTRHSYNCFGLEGEPGIGKTAFVRCLAEALDLPFYQISLAGIKDVNVLNGHSSTYIGAKCGQITEALVSMGYTNGILFLDEFDKLPQSSDVAQKFMHILDPIQNMEFRDEYLSDVKLDLSKLLIIISANNIGNINRIVRDRIDFIHMDGYTNNAKINIARDYIIPKIETKMGIKGNFILENPVISYIIEHCIENTKGIRQLEHYLGSLFEKLNALKIQSEGEHNFELEYKVNDFVLPYRLDITNLNKLMKNKRTMNTTIMNMYI